MQEIYPLLYRIAGLYFSIMKKSKNQAKKQNALFSELQMQQLCNFQYKPKEDPNQNIQQVYYVDNTFKNMKNRELFLEANFNFATLQNNQFTQKNRKQLMSEWSKIEYVSQNTQENNINQCHICLDELQFPKIIPCGHIFCYLCLLQYFDFDKSCKKCPVCQKLTSIKDLKDLVIQNQKSFEPSQEIQFLKLYKLRSANERYLASTGYEDSRFQFFLKVTPQYVINKILQPLINNILQILDEEKILYIQQAVEITNQRLKYLQDIKQKFKNEFIYQKLKRDSNVQYDEIYQESNGGQIFIHPICGRFLKNAGQDYQQIQSKIIQIDNIIFTEKLKTQYKNLNFLTISQKIQFCEIQMNEYLNEQEHLKYIQEMKNFRQRENQQIKEKLHQEEIYQKQVEKKQNNKYQMAYSGIEEEFLVIDSKDFISDFQQPNLSKQSSDFQVISPSLENKQTEKISDEFIEVKVEIQNEWDLPFLPIQNKEIKNDEMQLNKEDFPGFEEIKISQQKQKTQNSTKSKKFNKKNKLVIQGAFM